MKFESVQVKLNNNEIVGIQEAGISNAAELLATKNVNAGRNIAKAKKVNFVRFYRLRGLSSLFSPARYSFFF